MCHKVQMMATLCTCPGEKPFPGCHVCFSDAKEAANCGVSGCSALWPFAGCGVCFASAEEARVCGNLEFHPAGEE
ncbi:hypothetical protein DIPPA_11232 [Diplonema papillatum]|nr:hypothetical protein DIPPA_11232 [Diplonema papillatum]